MNYIMLYYTQLFINKLFNYNKNFIISNNGDIETGFELFKQPMPCVTNSCVSSADSKIPKRKINV